MKNEKIKQKVDKGIVDKLADIIIQQIYTVEESVSLMVHYENGAKLLFLMDSLKTHLTLSCILSGPTSLDVLNVPSSIMHNEQEYPVKALGPFLMSLCKEHMHLTKLILEASVDRIDPYAFLDAPSSLRTIELPDPSLLERVEIPEGVEVVSESFKVVDLRSDYDFRLDYESGYSLLFRLNNAKTKVGVCGIENPEKAIRVRIPEELVVSKDEVFPVVEIVSGCFQDCRNLRSVFIPNTIQAIGYFAFSGCHSLSSVTIPDSVTTIEGGAFDFTSLTSLNIPKTVTSIKGSICSGCGCLESVTVDKANSNYDSRDNCNAIIETATNALIQGIAKTVIPDTVTSIKREAFFGTQDLKTITIPDSVKRVMYDAFTGCVDLEEIVIKDFTLVEDLYLTNPVTLVTPQEKAEAVSEIVQLLKKK